MSMDHDRDDGTNVPGPASDAAGRPVFDPSKNVLDLVYAAVKRQDDLRESESRHVREIMAVRAGYEEKLSKAESSRIDAIRAVDVGTAERAAAVVANQATILATTVTTSAEALRAQNEVARVQVADQLRSALEPILKDVSELRRVQYETAGGKAQTVDSRSEGDSSRGLVLMLAAIAAVLSSAFFGAAAIVVTLILHG
jgi:hypothetical protein